MSTGAAARATAPSNCCCRRIERPGYERAVGVGGGSFRKAFRCVTQGVKESAPVVLHTRVLEVIAPLQVRVDERRKK